MHDQIVHPETTLVCHARTPLVLEPIEERIAEATACESTDLVDAVVVRSWPDSVRLDDDAGQDREVVDDFGRFREWADRRGVSVEPPFEVRTRSSIVEEDGVDVLVTPVLCLAVYRDERLVGVYPHSDGEETYTVERALERLREGELPRPLQRRDRPAVDSQRCPDCDAALLNGQGLFVCPDCGWMGAVTADGWDSLEEVEVGSLSSPSHEGPDPADTVGTDRSTTARHAPSTDRRTERSAGAHATD